jgi:hypothetical protein
MKILLTALALAFTASTVIAGGGSSAVSTASVKVLGAPNRRQAVDWVASTTYAAGEIVQAGPAFYLAIVPGTSSTAMPVGRVDQADGTVTWRHVMRHERNGLFLGNEGAAKLTFWWSGPVVSGTGIVLDAGEKLILSGADAPQTAVHVIGAAASTAATMEW